MDPMNLPPVNAGLNSLSAVLLLAGFVFIKKGNRKAHAACMVSALVTSAAFLACYLTYHYLKEGHVTRFPEEYPAARVVYLLILGTHTVLAVINLPMIILTVIPALRRRFDRHRRLARWTWPIWMYVSVTGVIVYFMLYQWFPPPPQKAAGAPSTGRSMEPGDSPRSPSSPGRALLVQDNGAALEAG